jgi:membrane protein implicated in regulation of membrane protease activity
MNSKLIKVTASAAGIALFASACENLTPGENAAFFGTAAGLAVGIPLAVSGVSPSVTIPVTAGAVALAAGGAYIIAKHQATERQRKIAEQRARIYMAKRAEAEKAAAQATTAKKSKKPRYIAVRTQKEDFNTGKEAVMVYDTQTNGLVGNQVWDLKSSPKVGSVQKFDTYSAEFVGG